MRGTLLFPLFILVIVSFVSYSIFSSRSVACSLPMIPVGCTWVSTATALTPCAGYISCPAAHNTSVTTNTSSGTFNYFNLTGSGYKNTTTGKLESFKTINNVSSVYVEANRTSASPGQHTLLNVTFLGTFDWDPKDPASVYYLSSKVINIHYFGVELQNQSGALLDQSNGPWYYYVGQIGAPHTYQPGNPNKTLSVRWVITPTGNVTNKTLKICGGYFAAYTNTTLDGGWGNAYNNLSMEQERVLNLTVINIPSQNCAYVKVA